jgi:hypothetical protein
VDLAAETDRHPRGIQCGRNAMMLPRLTGAIDTAVDVVRVGVTVTLGRSVVALLVTCSDHSLVAPQYQKLCQYFSSVA